MLKVELPDRRPPKRARQNLFGHPATDAASGHYSFLATFQVAE